MDKPTKRLRDDRGMKIKALLKAHYPSVEFRVRINKYSLGESIIVYAGLLDDLEWVEQRAKVEELSILLADYEHVRTDEYGDTLSGGNTYLFIHPLNHRGGA